jgi:hypothetical protein
VCAKERERGILGVSEYVTMCPCECVCVCVCVCDGSERNEECVCEYKFLHARVCVCRCLRVLNPQKISGKRRWVGTARHMHTHARWYVCVCVSERECMCV